MQCSRRISRVPLANWPKLVGIVLRDWGRPTVLWSMNRACRKRPCRLHVEGPLAPYFEPYSEYLAGRGYSQVSYWKKTFIVSDFSRWLGREGVAAADIRAEHEEGFLRDSARRHRSKARHERFALDEVKVYAAEQK